MGQIEKTVFISYRRTNEMHARAVYQTLKAHGFDCFLDFQNIDAGAFDQIILNQIKARAHFVLILTPSALERCNEPGDWLRKEIETAIDYKRNVVPLMMEGFSYGSPAIRQYLTGKLALLGQYNALEFPRGFFDEAMARLINRYLNVEIEGILHPILPQHETFILQIQTAMEESPKVSSDELRAAELFEDAYAKYDKGDYADAVAKYTQSLALNKQQPRAYFYRALAKRKMGNKPAALMDYSQALMLKPDYADAYYHRGVLRGQMGDVEGEIEDYSATITHDLRYYLALVGRAHAHIHLKAYDRALADANGALMLKPDSADAFFARARVCVAMGNQEAELADYTNAIKPRSKYALIYPESALMALV